MRLLLNPIKTGEFYPPSFVALAVNYSEQICDSCEHCSDEVLNRLVVDALAEKCGFSVDVDILNRSLEFYMESEDFDLGQFKEYFADLPVSWQ